MFFFLRNQELIELISSAVRDLAESNFIGDRDNQNNPLPSDPTKKITEIELDDETFEELDNTKAISMKHVMGNPEREWALRHILSAGALLGKSCQGTLKLAGMSENLQQQGYLFGKHLSLAWQACIDLEPFRMSELPSNSSFSLVSAPILFHLEYDAKLYDEIKKGAKTVDDIDYHVVHMEVLKGPGIEKTKELQRKHSLAARTVLNEFPPSTARTALQNIILAMQDL